MNQTPRLARPDLIDTLGRIDALGRTGFSVLRVKGSHHFLCHEDGRTTVVPARSAETIGPGLFTKILRDCQLTAGELTELLHKR